MNEKIKYEHIPYGMSISFTGPQKEMDKYHEEVLSYIDPYFVGPHRPPRRRTRFERIRDAISTGHYRVRGAWLVLTGKAWIE